MISHANGPVCTLPHLQRLPPLRSAPQCTREAGKTLFGKLLLLFIVPLVTKRQMGIAHVQKPKRRFNPGVNGNIGKLHPSTRHFNMKQLAKAIGDPMEHLHKKARKARMDFAAIRTIGRLVASSFFPFVRAGFFCGLRRRRKAAVRTRCGVPGNS